MVYLHSLKSCEELPAPHYRNEVVVKFKKRGKTLRIFAAPQSKADLQELINAQTRLGGWQLCYVQRPSRYNQFVDRVRRWGT